MRAVERVNRVVLVGDQRERRLLRADPFLQALDAAAENCDDLHASTLELRVRLDQFVNAQVAVRAARVPVKGQQGAFAAQRSETEISTVQGRQRERWRKVSGL